MWIKLVEKKEFIAVTLDLKNKTIVILVVFITCSDPIYLSE